MLPFPAQNPSHFLFSEGPTKGLDVSILFQSLSFNYFVGFYCSQGCLNLITFSVTKYLLEFPSFKCPICDPLIALFFASIISYFLAHYLS